MTILLGRVRSGLEGLGEITELCFEFFKSVFSHKLSWKDLTYQIYFIGVKSQSVVLVTGAFTGMVLCAQTFFQFHKGKMDTGTLAGGSGPMGRGVGRWRGLVLAMGVVAGGLGASMAAELGTMRVTEQVDALRTPATHPVDY